ncbi:hypothetical protein FOXB_10968 [Fusarium oxysporum f. sp. conglutinans Fo5176]|uniref:Uncharacterized protein n=1 Tax=Fusarium oxysporum (strain Fo5176) TaxID=660025 RepID=F9FX36_FUSOF|nr:hypothetical protein FOXB_10968 [Fusarium oxysporum f. sp. conglutinans Fo5176]
MTSTSIVIMMPKILRSMAIPKSPYPRIVPQQNRQTQYCHRPVRCINMSIPFPNWQVPLHKGQMHEPGSRHHRLRQLLTPTTRFSTASSVQSTGRRRQKARTFYAYRAACPRSCKIAESEHAHNLQERTEYIQRSLPPLHSAFDDLGAQTRNPHGSFSRWESFLSDQPSEPLSFRRTHASVIPESVTITRQWDVDSI